MKFYKQMLCHEIAKPCGLIMLGEMKRSPQSNFNFVQANVFTDPWDCTLFDNPWLVLNEDGLDYVKSKFGGDAKFCIRDYTKDYLDSAPFDNMQYDMVTPLELGLYSGNLRHYQFLGFLQSERHPNKVG